MFGWLFGNKEVKRVEEDTKAGFENVKKDISSVTGWIKHLDSERELQKTEIEMLRQDLSSIRDEMESLGEVIKMIGEVNIKRPFKTPRKVLDKQTPVYAVQTGVQTGVQTPNLEEFSLSERAILWILLNSDMKLSYEDLAAMTGKEKATIRGQINSIKQKSEETIKESIEKNGKKRLYIKEEIKEKLLKKQKVSVKKGEKARKK